MGPLSGVLVLDLGQYLAGPFGPMLLADLGAEVIKVEPVRGDTMRMVGMPFVGCQRGKLDLAVDIKAPEGLEAVMRLAEIADVVHHNMTKGTAARLGVDYEALHARNPHLVHCNTYAYGAEGPLSDFGGLDPLYQAACGLEYEAGPVHEGNPPLYLRFGMTDTANAMVSVVGVLAALYHQRRTGEGQDLWTSLLNGAAVFSSDVFLVDGAPGPVRPGLDRAQTGVSPCYRLYETQQGWIQVAAFGPGQWTQLCRVAGCPSSSGSTPRRHASPPGTRSSPPWNRPSSPAPPWRGGTISPPPASQPRSRSTPTTARSRCTTRTMSVSASSPSTRIRSWGGCANSARSSTSPRRAPGPTGRRP